MKYYLYSYPLHILSVAKYGSSILKLCVDFQYLLFTLETILPHHLNLFSTNQPADRSADRPTKKPTNSQETNQPTDQPTDQLNTSSSRDSISLNQQVWIHLNF